MDWIFEQASRLISWRQGDTITRRQNASAMKLFLEWFIDVVDGGGIGACINGGMEESIGYSSTI